jgi:hypothetical protein
MNMMISQNCRGFFTAIAIEGDLRRVELGKEKSTGDEIGTNDIPRFSPSLWMYRP